MEIVSPGLSTGNKIIDDQHQEILTLAREAMSRFDESRGGNSSEFHTLLNTLATLAARHFHTEETLLRQNACPTLKEHQEEHAAYSERILDLLMKAMAGNLDRSGLLSVMEDWTTHHLLVWDAGCVHYLQEGSQVETHSSLPLPSPPTEH
ncbi:bacteriohemerythrin [Zoogloea sp.]|uniref:bacteriohemerythrin n=1 Tax=Zoogloea sp. TaxID=49181 RepID=UPI0035B40CD9